MSAASLSNPAHSLTLCFTAVMMYLYDANRSHTEKAVNSIKLLQRAISPEGTAHNTACDVNAVLLCGQLLLETKQFKEVLEVLRWE